MAVDIASIIKLMELDEYKDMDIASIRRIIANGELTGQPVQELETSSISKIENENVGTKTKQLFDTYRKVDKEPAPKNYGDLARIMNISMEAPQEYKDPMGTIEYALKYTWSRLPEKLVYPAAQWVNELLASGSKKMGLSKVGTYFEKNAAALSTPPITEQVDKHMAWLYDEAKKKGKLNEAAFGLAAATTEALAFLTRTGIVKSIPGVGAAIPTGTTIPAKTVQMFTGLGTLPDVTRHAAVLGTMGMAETPGDFTSKLQGALYRIAYNITPFIANATGATGWTARATDTMLNMFLTSPSYVKAFKNSKNPGEFFVQTIPDLASDIIFAMQTTGTPLNQRLTQMGKIPRYSNMTRTEKIAFLDKVDKENAPKLPYGEPPAKLTEQQRLDTESIIQNMERMDVVGKKLNTGEEIKAEDIPTVDRAENKIFKESISERESIVEKQALKKRTVEGVKSGELTGAVRFGSAAELKQTLKDNKLPVSKEYNEIHAQPIMGKNDDYFAVYGPYDKHTIGIVIPQEYVQTKPDAHTKEVIVKPDVPVEKLRFIIKDKVYTYGEMTETIGGTGEYAMPRAVVAAGEGVESVGSPIEGKPEPKPGSLLNTRVFDTLINKAVGAVNKQKAISDAQSKEGIKALHKEKINTLLTPIYGIGKVPPDVTKKVAYDYDNLGKKMAKGINAYITGNILPENILAVLDGCVEYGPNKKALYLNLTDGFNNYTRSLNVGMDAARDMLPKLMQVKNAGKLVTEEKYNIGNGKFFLTDGELLGVYRGSFNKKETRHLKGNGFTDKDIQQAVDIVNHTPTILNTSVWMTQKYDEVFPRLAKVAKEVEGIDLPKEMNYSHIVRDKEYKDFNEDNIVQQIRERNNMKPGAYVEKGIIEARVRSAKPVKIDAISNYLRYLNEAEFYINMAPHIKNASAILSDQRYRTGVIEKLGKPAIQALDDYVKNVAGTKTGMQYDSVDRVAKILRRHTGIAMMGLNILSAMRQPLSSFQAAAEIGIWHVLNGIEQVAKSPIETMKFVYSKSIPTEYRAEQFERFMTEEKQAERAPQVLTGKKTWRQMAMAPIGAMDKWTVIAVWKGTYDRIMATGKTIDGDRINNADLERVAVMEADRVVRKTQPATAVKDLPGFHRGNVAALLMTQFQNQVNKNFNYFAYDIIGKKMTGKISGEQAAYKVLFSYILPAMLLGMVSRGGLPRNMGQIKDDLVRYPLAGAFFIGGLINNAVDDYGEWSVPGLQGPKDIKDAATAFYQGKWPQGIRFTVKGLAEVLGVPYSQLNRTYKGLIALMNGDVTDWRNLIWSEYALNKGKPKSVGLMPTPSGRKKRKEKQ